MRPSQELCDEIALLRLIYLKNGNQHHAQVWWKYFNIFMRRASQLSRSNRLDISTVEFLDRKLIPKLWRALHTALAQGAFLTITFAVMAGVARVSELLRPALPHKKPRQKAQHVKNIEAEDIGELVSVGDPIENFEMPNITTMPPKLSGKLPKIDAINSVFGVMPSNKRTDKKTKKKSKKKKTDAIDAIFG